MSESGARCPGCNVCFRITASQRRAAGGLVRCGFCLTVFDANVEDEPAVRLPARDVAQPMASPSAAGSTAALAADEEPPGAPATAVDLSQPGPADGDISAPDPAPNIEPPAEAEPAPVSASLTAPETAPEVESPPVPEPEVQEIAPQSEMTPEAPPTAVSDAGVQSAAAAEAKQSVADHEPYPRNPEPPAAPDAAAFDALHDLGSESSAAEAHAVPLWLLPTDSRAGGRRAPAVVAVAALGALLLQGLYFHADLLAERPELHGFYRVLCRVVSCQRLPYRDVAAIAVDQLVARAQGSGALRLDAMLTNRGRAAQPLPSVRLTFENLQGEMIAARRFAPQEYLDQPPPAALAAGQSLHLVLELVDPGPDAVSYSLAPVD